MKYHQFEPYVMSLVLMSTWVTYVLKRKTMKYHQFEPYVMSLVLMITCVTYGLKRDIQNIHSNCKVGWGQKQLWIGFVLFAPYCWCRSAAYFSIYW